MYAFRLRYQFYMQLLCRSMAYMRKTNVCTLYSREALTQVSKIFEIFQSRLFCFGSE